MLRKLISLALTIGLLLNQGGIIYAAGELNLSSYLSQTRQTIVKPDIFHPVRLRYFSYDSLNNSYRILLDKGNYEKSPGYPSTLPGASRDIPDASVRAGTSPEKEDNVLKETAQELMRYFLIGVTLPNDAFWVNLRPDAPENIIDPELERTDIGKIFLEADLQLKKDTANFTSPQTPEGKEYWDKLYKKAGELFGSENITIPTLTRPWIVPNEIIVRESDDSAYVYKATLKVLLEEDYLNAHASEVQEPHRGGAETVYRFSDPRLRELNEYSTQLIRERIIPKLTREVNSSPRYAKLRQVYYSLILSRWFKARFREQGPGNRGQGTDYIQRIDSRNLTNLTSKESWDKTTYFNQYKESFAKGEYNIKEPTFTAYGQSVRSYTSGGFDMTKPMPFEVSGQNQGAGSPIGGGSFHGKNWFNTIVLATGVLLSGMGGEGSSTKISLVRVSKQEAVSNAADRADVKKIRVKVKEMLDGWYKNNPWYHSEAYELDFDRLFFEKDAESIDVWIMRLRFAEGTLRFYEPSKANKDAHKQFENIHTELMKMIESFRGKEKNKNTGKDSLLLTPVKDGTERSGTQNMTSIASPLTLKKAQEMIVRFFSAKFKGKEDAYQKYINVSVDDLDALLAAAKEAVRLMQEGSNRLYLEEALSHSAAYHDAFDMDKMAEIESFLEEQLDKREKGFSASSVTAEALRNAGTMPAEDFILINITEKLRRSFNDKKDLESMLKACKNYMLEFPGKYVKAAKIKISEKEIEEITGTLSFYFNPHFMARPENIAVAAGYLSRAMKDKFEDAPIAKGFEELQERIKSIVAQLEKSENAVKADMASNKPYVTGRLYTYDNAKEKVTELRYVSGDKLTDRELEAVINGMRGLQYIKYSQAYHNGIIAKLKSREKIFLSKIRFCITDTNEVKGYAVILKGDSWSVSAVNGQQQGIEIGIAAAAIQELMDIIPDGFTIELQRFVTADHELLLVLDSLRGGNPLTRDLYGNVWLYKYEAAAIVSQYGKNMLEAVFSSVASEEGVSSAVVEAVVSPKIKRGGIDMTDKAMHINLERMGSFAQLEIALPELNNVEAIDLDNEFEQIQAMAISGIRPSDMRILEFITACYYRQEFTQRLSEIIACLKEAHTLDEREGRESSETLLLATLLPDALYANSFN